MSDGTRAGFGVAYGAVSIPAGAAAARAHAIPGDFAGWLQQQIWRWNLEDGSPMTLMGGKMGATANSELLLLEYSCLDEQMAEASLWVRQSLGQRQPADDTLPAPPDPASGAWRALMAAVAPRSHFDESDGSPAAAVPPPCALGLLRQRYGAASAIVTDEGVELVRPCHPWRPAFTPSAPGPAGPVRADARRTYFAVSLPGLGLDSGRQALALFACLNYGGLVTMLSRSGLPSPRKSRFQLMSYWGRCFIVGELRWAPGEFGRAEKELRRVLSRPRELAWLVPRAAPYYVRRTLDGSRERAHVTATRLLYGAELLEDLLHDTDWLEVLRTVEEPAVAVIAG